MVERPDSSLFVLEGINIDDIGPRRLHAKYALLLTQAKDKNYIDETDATLIDDAVEYYEESDNVRYKFLSHYYHGRILFNKGDYTHAIIAYTQAEELETVVYITNDMVQRFALLENNELDVAQQGTLEFYPRMATLFVDMEAQNGYDVVALEAKLLAYTNDYFVIEWQDEGINLRALFKRTNHQMMQLKEAELRFGTLLESVSPLDKSRVEELIVGKWLGSTMLQYDSADYASIIGVYELFGEHDLAPYPPGFGGPYTFSADGTMTYSFEMEIPPFETVTLTYTWSYDSQKNDLVVVDENGKSVSHSLIAVDDNWLIWDFEEVYLGHDETEYIRQAFARRE